MGGATGGVAIAVELVFVELDAEAGHIGGVRVAVPPADLDREEVGVDGAGRSGHLQHADVGGGHAERRAGRGAYGAQGIVRDYVDVVGLAPVGDLEGLGKPADVADIDAGVSDQLLLDDLTKVPRRRCTPFLLNTVRVQGNVHRTAGDSNRKNRGRCGHCG